MAGGGPIITASPAPIGTNAVADGGAGNDVLSQLSSRVTAGATGIGAESRVVEGGTTTGDTAETSRGRAAKAITDRRGVPRAGSTSGSAAGLDSVDRVGPATTAGPLLRARPRRFGAAAPASAGSLTLIAPLLRERPRAALTALAAATDDAFAVGTEACASTVVSIASAATISVVPSPGSKPELGGSTMPMPDRLASAAGAAGGAVDTTPVPEMVTSAAAGTTPMPARVVSLRGVAKPLVGIWIVFGRWRVGGGTGARVTRCERGADSTTGAVGSRRDAPSGITMGDTGAVGVPARLCARAASIGEALVLNGVGATLESSASAGGGAMPVPLPSKSIWTASRAVLGALHGSGRSPNSCVA